MLQRASPVQAAGVHLMLAPYVRLYQGAAPSEVANLGASAWKVSLLTDIPPYWKVRMLGYWPARTAASSAGLEKVKSRDRAMFCAQRGRSLGVGCLRGGPGRHGGGSRQLTL